MASSPFGTTARATRASRACGVLGLSSLTLVVALASAGCADSATEEASDSDEAEVIASGWKVDMKAPGADFAAIVATADGTVYAASGTGGKSGAVKVIARRSGVWSPVEVAFQGSFVEGAGVSLLADGNDVLVGGGEFYHLEVVRLHAGKTTPVVKNSYSRTPSLARSSAGKIFMNVGPAVIDLQGHELSVDGYDLAFDGETLKSVGSGIWRTVGDRSVVELEPVEGRFLEALWMDGKGNGVAVGRGGVVFQQRGGETSWSAVDVQVTTDLHAVWGRSASEIYAVGDRGVVLYWNGKNWSKVRAGTTANLHAVGGDARQVAIGGAGIIVRKGS